MGWAEVKAWHVVAVALCGLFLGLQWAHFVWINQRMDQFISKGPRFTAQDGYALCLRVQVLERAQGVAVTRCVPPEGP
jgi:hypothetical protein